MSRSKPAPALTECSYHTRKIPHAHIQAERVLVQTCSLDTGTRLSCEHTQALAGTRVRTNWTVEILTSAFVTLLVETPDKIFAHRTEGGLPKEGGDKLVVLDVVDFGLFDGSTPDHCWKHGLVFTPNRLLAIWEPWNSEVSCSPRGATLLQSLPGWPWTGCL